MNSEIIRALPVELQRAEPDAPPPDPRSRIALGILIVVAIILVSIALWLLVGHDRYEREGDAFVAQMRFEEALERYMRSLRRVTLGGNDRVLFKIGQTYEQIGDYVRANDIYFELMRDYVGSIYAEKAQDRARSVFEHFLNQGGPTVVVDSNAPLVVARATFRAHYERLVAAVAANRSGVTPRLREVYQDYREAFENYQSLLATEYTAAVRAREEERRRRAESSDVDGEE